MAKVTQQDSALKIGLLVAGSISVFSTNFLDPINWPKQISLLMLVSYLCYATVAFGIKRDWLTRKFLLALSISITLYALSGFLNFENTTRLMWGIWGRNNGLLTQLSLFLLAFTFSILSRTPNFTLDFFRGFSLGMIPATLYGLIQFLHLDWVDWSSKNQVFSFFGNSNFASSIFSIVSLMSFFVYWINEKKSSWSSVFLIHGFLSAFVAWQTKSIQGIVALFLGLALFTMVKLSRKLRVPPVLQLIAISALGSLVLFGFLGKGLLSFLYQYTFELRSYYWLIGIKMGMSSPLIGVGIDSYGDFYRLFRPLEVAQVTTVDLTVNNAHNSLIQVFATTGILGLVGILIWVGSAAFLSLRTILDRESKREHIALATILMIAFAISMISIDNIAVATIYWAFIGITLGNLTGRKSPSEDKISAIKPTRKGKVDEFRTILLTVIVGFVFTFAWSSSAADRDLLKVFSTPVSTGDVNAVNNRWAALKSIADSKSFVQEAQLGYIVDGIDKTQTWNVAYEVAKNGIARFPNDFALIDKAAVLAEKTGKFDEAEEFRQAQLQQDPRHALVWLYLARDFYEQTKLNDARKAIQKSIKFDALLDENGRKYRSNLEMRIDQVSK